MSPRKLIQYLLPLGAAACLLWWVYRDMSAAELARTFADAHYGWLLLSIVPALLSHLSRAQRWRLLLEPLGHRCSLYHAFLAVMSGYFANLIVPRLGEVTRCGVLRTTNGVPIDTSFGTVVAERAIDLLLLGLCVLLAFALEYDRLTAFLAPLFNDRLDTLPAVPFWLVAGGVLLLATALGLAFWFRQWLLSFGFVARVRTFLLGVWQGLTSVSKLRRPAAFVLHSLFIWFGYFLMSYWAFGALSATEALDWQAGLVLLVVGSLGMIAPVQGGVGAYHIMATGGFMLYAVSETDARAAAALLHTSQTLLVLVVGGLSFLLVMLKKRQRRPVAYDGQ